MEFSRSLAEHQEAYDMDSSPLSKLNLAHVFFTGGRLTEALLYANACLRAEDEYWMLNYGIDPVRYRRDIHRILMNTYEGLFNAEAFSSPGNMKEGVQSLFRKISYRFSQTVHTFHFRKYSLLAANAYPINGREEIHLEALINYHNAFEAYPRRALAYLIKARSIEEPLIPESAPVYDFGESRLLKNRRSLAELPGAFDPLWQRDMIAMVYQELAALGSRAERQDAAERLFAINRGALLRNGVRLPVELQITGGAGRMARILRNATRAAGLETTRLQAPRYTLSLDASLGGYISGVLYDNGRGIIVWQQTLPAPNRRGSQAANFARSLRDGIFNAF
jgi:hypothetical protein